VLRQLKAELGEELRLVWRHRPLTPESRLAAAMAAELSHRYGSRAAFQFIDRVLTSDAAADREALKRVAVVAGADTTLLERWRTGAGEAPGLERDRQLAGVFGVRATPTLYLNGLHIVGHRTIQDLRKLIVEQRNSAIRAIAAGVAKRELYAARTKKNLIGVGTDPPERRCPLPGESPSYGAKQALLTVVEFSDFECRPCMLAQSNVERALRHHASELRVVFKSLVLENHRRARAAVNFALEAERQSPGDGFWRARRLLFAGQAELDESSLGNMAARLGLEQGELLRAASTDRHAARIEADRRAADEFGVDRIPTFFVNGRRIASAQEGPFSELIQDELSAARRLLDAGVPRPEIYDALCEP
jgi:protein-disulfide isomerase